jgi:hypothetical protein
MSFAFRWGQRPFASVRHGARRLRRWLDLYRDYPIARFHRLHRPAGTDPMAAELAAAVGCDWWRLYAARCRALPLAQGLLAAEMAMNLQMALGWRRHLLLHASAVERDGRVLVMTGAVGIGQIDTVGAARLARLAFSGRRVRPARSGDWRCRPVPAPDQPERIMPSPQCKRRSPVRASGRCWRARPRAISAIWCRPQMPLRGWRRAVLPALLLFPALWLSGRGARGGTGRDLHAADAGIDQLCRVG